MASYAPNSQSRLYNHMWDFTDLRSKKDPVLCVDSDSIYAYLRSNPKFSRFRSIVDRAQMASFLGEMQSNCTLFVPSNDSLKHIPSDFFDTMDTGQARSIVASSTLPRKLAKDLLTSSPVAYYYTKYPSMRMYVTNISGETILNGCVKVIEFDHILGNGFVHIVDGLIIPNEDHFMN